MNNGIITHFKDKHRRARAAARGATVCLVDQVDSYECYLSCAETVRKHAPGMGKLKDYGNVFEEIPVVTIPLEQIQAVMDCLRPHASVALISTKMSNEKDAARLVCFYTQRVEATTEAPVKRKLTQLDLL